MMSSSVLLRANWRHRQRGWCRFPCQLPVSGGWRGLRSLPHQIRLPPIIQLVRCLHLHFPICCLPRRACNVSILFRVFGRPPLHPVCCWQKRSILFIDTVLITYAVFLKVPTWNERILSFFEYSHTLPQWPDPADCSQDPAQPVTLLVELVAQPAPWLRLSEPPKLIYFVRTLI